MLIILFPPLESNQYKLVSMSNRLVMIIVSQYFGLHNHVDKEGIGVSQRLWASQGLLYFDDGNVWRQVSDRTELIFYFLELNLLHQCCCIGRD